MGIRFVLCKKVQTRKEGPQAPISLPPGRLGRRSCSNCRWLLDGDAGLVLEVLQVGGGAGFGQACFSDHAVDDVLALHRRGLAVRIAISEHGAGFVSLGDHGGGNSSGWSSSDGFFVGIGVHDGLTFYG